MISLKSDADFIKERFVGEILDASLPVVESNFTECVFEKCSFAGAIFRHCSFSHCHFLSCDQSGMVVADSKWMDARFQDGKAIGIDWTKASPFNLSLSFVNVVVDYSVFFGLKIANFKLERCRAHEADFQEAHLRNASFIGSDLSGSEFHQTDLTGASFKGAMHYAIHPQFNALKGAIFSFPDALALLTPLGVVLDYDEPEEKLL